MRVYRVDKPHPTLVGDSRMEILPLRIPGEPITGYALQIDGYLVELSFHELDRIIEVRKGVSNG